MKRIKRGTHNKSVAWDQQISREAYTEGSAGREWQQKVISFATLTIIFYK